jgi:hypothetical protein
MGRDNAGQSNNCIKFCEKYEKGKRLKSKNFKAQGSVTLHGCQQELWCKVLEDVM